VTIQTCDSKYDKWEHITNPPGSENIVSEFNNKWEEVYKIKMALRRQGQMEMTTLRRASLRRASLNMRMRMGKGEGVKEHNCKNGGRCAAFASQHKQC